MGHCIEQDRGKVDTDTGAKSGTWLYASARLLTVESNPEIIMAGTIP